MIDNSSKQKLINSFNNVVIAVHNLRATIASEGKRAFIECDTNDINELMGLMSKVNEISNKLDKVAGPFKSYSLDIATDTHPSEFPINIREIHKSNSKDNIELFINSLEGTKLQIKFNNQDTFTLTANQTFTWNKVKLPKYVCRRLSKLLSTDSISLINEQNNIQLLIINKEIKFKSANSLASFILCRNIDNGDELIHLTEDKDLKRYNFERYIGS